MAEEAIMSRAELMEALRRSEKKVEELLTSILAGNIAPKCDECQKKRNDFLANALDEGARR